MEYILSDYVDIGKVITDKGYRIDKHLKLKNKNGLYLIKYDKEHLSITNEKSLGLFRSVITDGQRILCFAPPKSINFDVFSQTNNFSECRFEEFIEGTMINLFWNPIENDWNIATRSSLDARCKYNINSEKTFRYMFIDAMNEQQIELDMFNKDVCYSFVLRHPDNRIVVPTDKPELFLTNVFRCLSNNGKHIVEELDKNSFLIKTQDNSGTFFRTPLILNEKNIEENITDWDSLIKYYSSDNLDYTVQGVIIYNGKCRAKYRSKNYEMVKHLKGNTPKIQYQYINLRQANKVKEFLHYYPEYRKEFSKLRKQLHDWTNQLYQNYINCYIKKQKSVKEFPYNFKTHMFNLHKLYIDQLKPDNSFISKKVVVDYVNNLPAPRLMYSVNYIYNKHKLDISSTEKKIKLQNKS